LETEEIIVRPVSGQAFAGYALLEDIYRQPGMILRVDLPKGMYGQGQMSLVYLLGSLLLAGLVFGAVILVIFEKWVLARLARLSQEAHRIGASGDLTARVSVKGEDELTGLAQDMNQMLQNLERAQKGLQSKTELLTAVTEAMTVFLGKEDWQEASALLLSCALRQTESEYGFIGVVVEGPVLRILAHEGIAWDKTANREFYEGALQAYQKKGYHEFTNFNNLFGKVLTTGQVVISNSPQTDPASGGLPAGHPPLHRFMGIPIHQGTRLVGVIGVANRQEGYGEAQQLAIESLVRQAGVLYDGYIQRLRETALENDRRQVQNALQESEARLHLVINQIPAILWTTDTNLNITSSVGAGLVGLGLRANQLVGMTLYEYLQTDNPEFPAVKAHHQALKGESAAYELKWIGRVYHSYVEPLYDAQKRVIGCIGLALDVTNRKRVEMQLEYWANHDSLTGLFNRRRFKEELEQRSAQAEQKGSQGALLWLDLDRFKEINDSFGHRAGDALLIEISLLLQKHLSKSDTLARLGGDEFAIVLGNTSLAEARASAQRLLQRVRQHTVTLQGQPVHATVSIGITRFPQPSITIDELLAQADRAMYQAKDEGRNRYSVFAQSEDWQAQMEAQVAWAEQIREALNTNRFLLQGQPILHLGKNKTTQYELLLRMVKKSGELALPDAFLETAERYGLIQEIDRWVLGRAIRFLAQQAPQDEKLSLTVNISGKTVTNPETLEFIREELQRATIDPALLVLEITEKAAVADFNQARQWIETLKNLGCRIAIDDFGTGFSWFYPLKQLPVDLLKIDGSFIKNLSRDSADQHLVKAMIEVARGLGIETIAENVENAETMALLRAYGVTYAQGYYIGTPQPLSQGEQNLFSL
jgi:diguanylate cyclase (GGDEF)-like protein/PAS domain S-box-containing protein